MRIGKLATQTFTKYKFVKKDMEQTFELLKKKYNLQIVIEGNGHEKVYLNAESMLVVKEMNDGIHYKEYERTDKTIESLSLQEIKKRKQMNDATIRENVMYDNKILYSLF